ncbi:MAG: transglutaminase family protein [Rhizobacter sp.]|nr:transglutaminase family protein [Rhizobacter sp.]
MVGRPAGQSEGTPRDGQVKIDQLGTKCAFSWLTIEGTNVPTVYLIDCELNYQVYEESTFIFNIQPSLQVDQTIADEQLSTVPEGLVPQQYTDYLGNRYLKYLVPPGGFSIRYQCNASVPRRPDATLLKEVDPKDLPLDILPFLGGSRYVESEVIFYDALNWIGSHDRGWARVNRICEWVHDNVEYRIGSSLANGTALDVLKNRTGVCRDFAHVSIALCRTLAIPARFVTGHVHWDTPPPDFHALFEAYLDGQWVLFDATRMAHPSHVVRIGTGFDAADVAFSTIFGRAQMSRMSPLVVEQSGLVLPMPDRQS